MVIVYCNISPDFGNAVCVFHIVIFPVIPSVYGV